MNETILSRVSRLSEAKKEGREKKKKEKKTINIHAGGSYQSTIVILNEINMVTEKQKRQLNLALDRAREIKKKKNEPQEVSS